MTKAFETYDRRSIGAAKFDYQNAFWERLKTEADGQIPVCIFMRESVVFIG
ncbi:MAG: hypothetical protein LBM69_10280 [Lachnospiraceae bacterium]|jgi:hypothetical protein|nr:hypothetical protein [Lachnospiraceae bacterium]